MERHDFDNWLEIGVLRLRPGELVAEEYSDFVIALHEFVGNVGPRAIVRDPTRQTRLVENEFIEGRRRVTDNIFWYIAEYAVGEADAKIVLRQLHRLSGNRSLRFLCRD